MRKDVRRADLHVRPLPLGQELRCTLDGSILWTEVFKPGDGRRMGDAATFNRREFEARGWVLADEEPPT